METFIIIMISVWLVLWLYHRYQYSKTSYQKFEYYLYQFTFVSGFIFLGEILVVMAIGGVLVYGTMVAIYYIMTYI